LKDRYVKAEITQEKHDQARQESSNEN